MRAKYLGVKVAFAHSSCIEEHFWDSSSTLAAVCLGPPSVCSPPLSHLSSSSLLLCLFATTSSTFDLSWKTTQAFSCCLFVKVHLSSWLQEKETLALEVSDLIAVGLMEFSSL